MKKTFQFVFAGIILIAVIVVLPSYSSTQNSDLLKSELKMPSDNTCTLYVKTRYGSAAKSAKVSTDVSGGISCAGGRTFYTDSDGKVTLKWSKGCYLKHIYIKGKGYDVNFKNGETYTIKMR